jgi:hypothetical protein
MKETKRILTMMTKEAMNDPGFRKFAEIMREVEIPDFVKEASVEEDLSHFRSDVFADPAQRRYPLTSKSNAWLADRYFEKDKHEYTEKRAELIRARIDESLSFWGVESSPALAKEAGVTHKIVAKHEGETVFETAIETPGQYKEAAEQLYNNRAGYTYQMRRSLARDLNSLPSELKTDLPEDLSEYLEKAAGFGCMDQEGIYEGMKYRMASVYQEAPELVDQLLKTAETLTKGDNSIATLTKVANILDLVDRATDLHKFYGNGLETPEECLFGITEKKASAFLKEAVQLTTGHQKKWLIS